jgi:hypothetical protein
MVKILEYLCIFCNCYELFSLFLSKDHNKFKWLLKIYKKNSTHSEHMTSSIKKYKIGIFIQL